MLSEDAPAHYETSWHGSNLYVARSIIETRTMEASHGSHGHYGVWSNKVSRRSKCGSYMYYIPSGSGVVWGVMFELRVDRAFTKVSGANYDQWVTLPEHVRVVSAWFHGVSQSDFWPCMYIWPVWDPRLEVFSDSGGIVNPGPDQIRGRGMKSSPVEVSMQSVMKEPNVDQHEQGQ